MNGRKAGIERPAAIAVVVAATLYTIWLGSPDVALDNSAPIGTDLGGHLVALKHLIEVSIPSGHLFDWSHEWFAGYPSFYFYFPLPALLIATITLVMPLNVTGKLVAVLAPALLPLATYVFVRAMGFGRLHASCAVVGCVAFLALTSQYIFGGNVLSSVIGEYSYAIGFAFAFLYLGRVALVLRGERHTTWLAIMLAATALSHSIPALFAVAGSCVALRRPDARRQIVLSWIFGFGLSAFWALPFLVRSQYMGRFLWTPAYNLHELFPLPVLLVLPWAAASLFALRSNVQKLQLLVALGAFALALYLIPHSMFGAGRSLPFWHFALYTFTALGVATGLRLAWEKHNRSQLIAWAAGLAILIGVSAIQQELVRKRSAELLSNQAPDAAAYGALLSKLRQLPAGRLHWEYRRTGEGLLGATIPLARVPSAIPNMTVSQGLLLQSAITAPAYWYLLGNLTWDTLPPTTFRAAADNDRDDERMRSRLRQLGIDYYVTFSREAAAWTIRAPDSFERLASDSAWTVWRVRRSALVEPVSARPRIVPDGDWNNALVEWLETVSDTTPWPVLDRDGAAARLNQSALAAAPVNIRSALEHRTVRFTTSAVGIPHIVRVAYFPNWRAYGAAGPYLAVPGFMMVVPTQRDVTLRFERTWAEQIGVALSLITLIVIVALWLSTRNRRTSPC